MNDEYLAAIARFYGEFALMANAHALEEGGRRIVKAFITKDGGKAIAVSSSQGEGACAPISTAPRRNICGNMQQRTAPSSISIRQCCRSGTRR